MILRIFNSLCKNDDKIIKYSTKLDFKKNKGLGNWDLWTKT